MHIDYYHTSNTHFGAYNTIQVSPFGVNCDYLDLLVAVLADISIIFVVEHSSRKLSNSMVKLIMQSKTVSRIMKNALKIA